MGRHNNNVQPWLFFLDMAKNFFNDSFRKKSTITIKLELLCWTRYKVSSVLSVMFRILRLQPILRDKPSPDRNHGFIWWVNGEPNFVVLSNRVRSVSWTVYQTGLSGEAPELPIRPSLILVPNPLWAGEEVPVSVPSIIPTALKIRFWKFHFLVRLISIPAIIIIMSGW